MLRFIIVFFAMYLICLYPIKIYSQHSTNEMNCDSLINSYEGMISDVIDKYPVPKRSIAEIQNDFVQLVNTKIQKTIYIKVFIDTSGNTYCAEVLRGNGNYIDTLALRFVTLIEFYPAERLGVKVPIIMSIPFYSSELNETTSLIKKDNKWFQKNN